MKAHGQTPHAQPRVGLARSTYYEQSSAPADDTAIVETIAAICDEFECYGWRRVRAALRQQGMVVNHKKIRRLMREYGLQPKLDASRCLVPAFDGVDRG